jgi:hypothetical protein
MLCPYCLHDTRPKRQTGATGEEFAACRNCQHVLPPRYIKEYAKYPPLPFSVMGLKGHGKTVFWGSLICELDRIIRSGHWRPFSYDSVDPYHFEAILNASERLERGELPESTHTLTPEPLILRVDSMPRLGNFSLIFYDVSGEVFMDSEALREGAWNLARSRLVVWFLSLTDLESPRESLRLLSRYTQYLTEKHCELGRQGMLLVLTKWDEVANRLDPPRAVTELIMNQSEPLTSKTWASLEAATGELTQWLHDTGHAHFLLNAQKVFRTVKVCAVSALGSAPRAVEGGQRTEISVVPRGVLWPLYLLGCHVLPHVTRREPDGKLALSFSLREALASAGADCTLELSPGDHHLDERLAIRASLRLEGRAEEPRAARIVAGPNASLEIDLADHEGTPGVCCLRNLALTRAPRQAGPAVDLRRGRLELSNCALVGSREAGALEPDRPASGLVVRGQAQARVQRCLFQNHKDDGITARDQAQLQVAGCLFQGNKRYGISAGSDVKLEQMAENTFKENGQGDVYQAPPENPADLLVFGSPAESEQPAEQNPAKKKRPWFGP